MKIVQGILGKTIKEFQIISQEFLKELLPVKKFDQDFEKILST